MVTGAGRALLVSIVKLSAVTCGDQQERLRVPQWRQEDKAIRGRGGVVHFQRRRLVPSSPYPPSCPEPLPSLSPAALHPQMPPFAVNAEPGFGEA